MGSVQTDTNHPVRPGTGIRNGQDRNPEFPRALAGIRRKIGTPNRKHNQVHTAGIGVPVPPSEPGPDEAGAAGQRCAERGGGRWPRGRPPHSSRCFTAGGSDKNQYALSLSDGPNSHKTLGSLTAVTNHKLTHTSPEYSLYQVNRKL